MLLIGEFEINLITKMFGDGFQVLTRGAPHLL
jgi:uncharacterized membrane protein YuzA (DUF378 family)